MARKTVLVSDLSGNEIPDDQHVELVANFRGDRYTADVLKEEVSQLLAVATKGRRRGRPRVKTA